jgi:large conductance mechanosensitive channel
MWKGFRDFLFRGNVVDLAVAVVIGAAFGAIVTALVKDLITPLIAALFGKPDFSALIFTINNSKFLIGDFINSVVSFVLIGSAIYFLIVLPMNTIHARFTKPAPTLEPTTKECPECLSTIPVGARRCAHCTVVLAEARR